MEITNPAVLKIIERRTREEEEKKEKQKARKKEVQRLWRIANSEQAKEVIKKWHKAHPEKTRAYKAKWRDHHRAELRDIRLKYQYGLSQIGWDALFERQGSCCAICKTTKPNDKTGWHTDHCHKTKVIRGILCGHCNRALGSVKDEVRVLREMIVYLERFTP